MSLVNEYAKRIPAYLDGMMSDDERLELEGQLGSDPELARLFRQKQSEQNSLVERVPQIALGVEAQAALEVEVREIIENLFKDEDAPATKKLKSWFEELF